MSKKGIFLTILAILSIAIDVFCLVGTMIIGLPPVLINVMTVVTAISALIIFFSLVGLGFFKFLYFAMAAALVYEGVSLLIFADMVGGIVALVLGVVLLIFVPKVVFGSVK